MHEIGERPGRWKSTFKERGARPYLSREKATSPSRVRVKYALRKSAFNENERLWGKLGESAEQMLGEGMSGHNDWRTPSMNMLKNMKALSQSMNQKT